MKRNGIMNSSQLIVIIISCLLIAFVITTLIRAHPYLKGFDEGWKLGRKFSENFDTGFKEGMKFAVEQVKEHGLEAVEIYITRHKS